jgi:general secretion pathway protein C
MRGFPYNTNDMNMKYIEYVYERHQKIANMIGTILVAWILSALVCSFIGLFLPTPSVVTPARASENNSNAQNFDPQQRDIAFYMPICERNLFDSAKQSTCDNRPAFAATQDEAPQVDPNADPVKSSINAKLLGTMVSTNDKYSFATVTENGKKEPENYRIGDLLAGIAKIYAIERNRVYFTNSGRKEYLEVDRLPSIYRTPQPSTASPTPSEGVKVQNGKVTISKSKVDSTLQDLNQVIQQARMVPNYENGQVDGFKIFGIKSGSIFQDLGLQNGDVINNINGTQIDSLEKALPMLQLLKTESSYTIDVTRKGSKQTMSINIQ